MASQPQTEQVNKPEPPKNGIKSKNDDEYKNQPCQTLVLNDKNPISITDPSINYLGGKPKILKVVSYNCEWCADPTNTKNMKFILEKTDPPPAWGEGDWKNGKFEAASDLLNNHLLVCIYLRIYTNNHGSIFNHSQIRVNVSIIGNESTFNCVCVCVITMHKYLFIQNIANYLKDLDPNIILIQEIEDCPTLDIIKKQIGGLWFGYIVEFNSPLGEHLTWHNLGFLSKIQLEIMSPIVMGIKNDLLNYRFAVARVNPKTVVYKDYDDINLINLHIATRLPDGFFDKGLIPAIDTLVDNYHQML